MWPAWLREHLCALLQIRNACHARWCHRVETGDCKNHLKAKKSLESRECHPCVLLRVRRHPLVWLRDTVYSEPVDVSIGGRSQQSEAIFENPQLEWMPTSWSDEHKLNLEVVLAAWCIDIWAPESHVWGLSVPKNLEHVWSVISWMSLEELEMPGIIFFSINFLFCFKFHFI